MPKLLETCFHLVLNLPKPFSDVGFLILSLIWAFIVVICVLIPVVLLGLVLMLVSPNSRCASEALGYECVPHVGHGHPSHDSHESHEDDLHGSPFESPKLR